VAKRTATIAAILAMALVAGACGDDAGVRVQSASPITVGALIAMLVVSHSAGTIWQATKRRQIRS